MALDDKILDILQNDYLIRETNFQNYFDGFYRGKVRDNYIAGDKRVIIASDRLSAFDRVITAVPFKGQVLNQSTAFWFEQTKDTVPNHVLSVPDPNVMVVKQCTPLPIEIVIRAYITGSAWRSYEEDPERTISGIMFPAGLAKNQKLDAPVITPSTKSDAGHDEAISRDEILAREIVKNDLYSQIEEYTYKLFEKGTEIAAKNGLILVDTKYEFGLDADGQLVVIDEIHTPDSSRFWMADSYQERFDAQEDPEVLDKEFFRDWLRNERNFSGEGEIPDVDDDVKVALCKKYIKNFEINTGQEFDYSSFDAGIHPIARIESRLKELGYIA
jgi:phosphoribosylaminoimidazole-succinocarboxamide synthase